MKLQLDHELLPIGKYWPLKHKLLPKFSMQSLGFLHWMIVCGSFFFTIWFLIHSLSLQVEVTLNTSSASYYWLCSFGKLNLSSVGDYTSIYSTLRGRNTTQRAWSDWHPYWLSWSTLAPSLSLSIDLFWQSPSFSPLWFQCLNNQICLLVTV